ncbi:putative Short-chain dehydrogenase [Aspergillus mulundensis]|uniref:Putative Short-chain dehydrogenase n=1 Tax=Aspergillus mulundensis TaxID=1810919 RepID=A0A3D8R933_9EURO|nr:putative Short-chain dehydrogenase [Aspergillus mulundensis]RDW70557.1 putative Short-chain dehydrogenase [Aspergillus mulundensis]
MVSLNLVRKSNAALRTLTSPPTTPNKITALFVGGTSGIGLSTLRALARHTEGKALTAYIVGRSESRAKPVLSELQSLSPTAKFKFIEADVSLIRNVDRACKTVLQNENGPGGSGKLDFLFMTPGGISVPFRGRDETPEGIDRLFSLRYYARMRFIQNLLPLLSNTQGKGRGRVLSIYGGGFEHRINKCDLDLKHKHTFSLLNAYKHSITMTSLAMAHLAKVNRNVSFIHAFPGLVGTSIYRNSFPGPVAKVYEYGVWPLLWPFSVGVQESGERGLFHLTSGRYSARNGGDVGGEEGEVAVGVDGVKGGGAYLLNWKGEVRGTTNSLKGYLDDGTDGVVWRHTEALLGEAAERTL